MSEVTNIFGGTSESRSGADLYVQQFAVPFSYPVYFTESVFHPDNTVFVEALSRLDSDRCHRIVVFIDEGVAAAWDDLSDNIGRYAERHAESLNLVAPPEVIPGGETVKTDPAIVERLQHRMAELGIDRHSYVIAIGGGALLDMVGYVAATCHRGLRLVRLPTSVLGQNDSGVGVKTGINAYGLKNFLGSFAPPFAVINDQAFLATLSQRDRRAGMAEAVKVALIRDGAFFAALEANADALAAFDKTAVAQMVRRCAEIHMHQIAYGGDPFETGSARPLDFGHWAAHKLESLTEHAVRHGEAVAIGIALDSRYSVLQGLLDEGHDERVCDLLERLGFELWHPALETRTVDGNLTILAGLQEFREHLGGALSITMLTGIGTCLEVNEMDDAVIRDCLAWLKGRKRTP
ncbi:MAG: 3-dehydroquinate synthase [Rhodospirillaceae bacterium]|jgi:3-dehydroquinate synthase|nr:3-dehydroquinate synthase [Rhodospirillaceae bacterium]|tara:strand:- start:1004 stop:2221 length:1218 start_codon:yes stop_codon:yes gene_type:complete